MDFAAFKAALEAARAFEVQMAGATFKLRQPTDHAWRLAHERHVDARGALLLASAMRELLNSAVVGWDGVTGRHFMADGTADALPFTPEARALLLDNRQDIADELSIALTRRVIERQNEREAAAKN